MPMMADDGAAIGADVPPLGATMRASGIVDIFCNITSHLGGIVPLAMRFVGIDLERPHKLEETVRHLIDGDSERFLALFAHGHSDESVFTQWGNLCHS